MGGSGDGSSEEGDSEETVSDGGISVDEDSVSCVAVGASVVVSVETDAGASVVEVDARVADEELDEELEEELDEEPEEEPDEAALVV